MIKKTLLTLSLVSLATGSALAGSGHGKGHWGYEGHEGPENWGSLSSSYKMCSEGKQQSPVDISAAHAMGLKPIEFHYKSTNKPEVVNNGHTIQLNYSAGSYAVIGGKKYNLLQFHFHAPSEHTVDGKHADMVAHLVHKSDDGQLAVVGVLFDQGKSNGVISDIFNAAPTSKGNATLASAINVSDMLPKDKGYYNYSGSLTTPPCSEGVNWNVLKSRVTASAKQINKFKEIHAKSIRPVQPLNGRMLSEL